MSQLLDVLETVPDGAILHRDEHGYIDWFMVDNTEPKYASHGFSGGVYMVDGWTDKDTPCGCDLVSPIYLKWDGCCHLGLRDVSLNKDWVHICGAKSMRKTLQMLEWAWKQAQDRISSYLSKERL